VAGLIISTDARHPANDKMHAIYPLMCARFAPAGESKKWPDIIMIISALWRLFIIMTTTVEIMMLKSGKITRLCYLSPFGLIYGLQRKVRSNTCCESF